MRKGINTLANLNTAMLMQIAMQIPVILVCVAGIVIALLNLDRIPRPAAFALAALMVYLILIVVFSVLPMAIMQKTHTDGWTQQRVASAMSTISFVGSFLRAGALGLLVAAVFSGRGNLPGNQIRRQP